MEDDSSRRSPKDINPFSFVSFLKQHKSDDEEEFPDVLTPESPEINRENDKSEDDSNPFSIKNIIKMKSQKMFPKLPTVSTDSEDECGQFLVRNSELKLDLLSPRRPVLIIEDDPPEPQVLEKAKGLPNNETSEEEDTMEPVTFKYSHKFDYKKEIKVCRLENLQLQAQLKESQRIISDKDLRINSLELELKKVKAREAEDTATLEKMMHSIESNLKLTTERAIAAETNVLKLKQEAKTLQTQVSALEEQLRASILEDIVSTRARGIADKLNQAANQAEASLKDLLEGAGQLRLLSSVLGDLTKVTETS